MKLKPLKALLAVCIIFAGILIVDPLLNSGSARGFGLIHLAYAETSGNSTGTATVGNAAPTITDPMLLTIADADANNTDLDVFTEYWSNCSVNDNNTLMNLHNVTWYIYEDNAADWDTADANETHYTFKYDNATDAFAEVGPDAAGGHLVAANCTKPNRALTTDDVKLAFKLEKTANHTGSKSWRVNITVWDAAASAYNQSLVFGVNYYFELTVDDNTHGWGALTAGDINVTIDSPVDGDIDLTCTSNAIFKLQAKSWNATLNATGIGDIDIGNVTIHESLVDSSVSLTVAYADIGGLDNEAAAYAVAKAFVLWISVPVGTAAGAYTYVLAVQGIEA